VRVVDDSPLRALAALVALQLAGAAAVGLPVLAVGGFCAAWVPPAGAAGAAFLFFLFIGRQGSLDRATIRALSLGSGLAHGALVAAGYAVAVAAWPTAFNFPLSATLFLAPLLGVAGGLVAAALTLCAGDGAAAAVGGYRAAGD
jgi:hypothetical protein